MLETQGPITILRLTEQNSHGSHAIPAQYYTMVAFSGLFITTKIMLWL